MEGRWRQARTESALSPPARASGWIEGSRKFKSYGFRSELYASAMSVTVACPYFCRSPISSTAASLGTGTDRGGVRDFIRHIGHREQHHALGRPTYADREFGAHLACSALTVSRADPFARWHLALATNAVRNGCVVRCSLARGLADAKPLLSIRLLHASGALGVKYQRL